MQSFMQMRSLSKEEFIHMLRRQGAGTPRGNSRYKGVALQKCGQWEARTQHFLDKKRFSYFTSYIIFNNMNYFCCNRNQCAHWLIVLFPFFFPFFFFLYSHYVLGYLFRTATYIININNIFYNCTCAKSKQNNRI